MQMPFERILVTGGTGFIGRYVTAHLVAAGIRPTITNYGKLPEGFVSTSSVDLLHLDIRDHGETARVLSEVRPDLVIHLAGITGQTDRDGDLCDEINHLATVHLLNRLSAIGTKKIVMVGTAAEYGAGPTPFREEQPDDARSPYAISRSKANSYALSLAEKQLLEVSILRLFSVYGVGQPTNMFLPELIAHAVSGREFAMTAGQQIRDFVHVEDVATAILSAAANPQAKGIINIGRGVGYRVSDVAKAVWQYCGADENLLRIGDREASGDGAFDTLADITVARRVLAWSPSRTFMEDGLRPGEALVEMIEYNRTLQGAMN